jgi:hypothetical protein
MANKTRTPKVSEEELARYHARFVLVASGAITAVKWIILTAGVVAGLYVTFYLPVEASQGKVTTISVTQQWLVDAKIHIWIAWGAALTGVGYGYNERRLRHRERAEKDARIKRLEEAIDPNRTSSNIDQRGKPQSGKNT